MGRWLIFGLIISLVVVACGKSDKPSYTVGQELTLSGKMKIIDNDGEAYVLVTEKGEFFDVHGIKAEYRKEGVPIKAVVKITALTCLHNAGPVVEVKEYLQ